MALTKLTTDLDNIQALSDTPNSTEGLTSEELKEKFDKAGGDIKTYINNTLTSEVDVIGDAVDVNTAKNGYPTADATKVGFISVTQAVNLDTMESNIATNNSKVSYPGSASETELNYLVGVTSNIQTQLGTKLTASNNLSDVSSASTSRTNLGLGSIATADITKSTSNPSGGSDGDIWIKYS